MEPLDNEARLAFIRKQIIAGNEFIRQRASREINDLFNAWLRSIDGKIDVGANHTGCSFSRAHITFAHAARAHPAVLSSLAALASGLGYAVKNAPDGAMFIRVQGDIPADLANENPFTEIAPVVTRAPDGSITSVSSVNGQMAVLTVASSAFSQTPAPAAVDPPASS